LNGDARSSAAAMILERFAAGRQLPNPEKPQLVIELLEDLRQEPSAIFRRLFGHDPDQSNA